MPPTSPIRKVVIFGHTGFIGSSLARKLKADMPGIEVVGYSTNDMDLLNRNAPAKVTGDLTPETAVVYCSAIKRQSGDSLETFSANMQMVRNMAELLEKHPVGRFILFSSAAVYGEDVPYDIISEDTGVHPVSYYGIGKFTAERLFWKTLAPRKHTSYVFLRPATVYGPGDRGFPYGPSGFSHKAVNNERITLWGNGGELREFIYIDDMTELTKRFLTNDYQGTINIVSGISYTFQDVLNEVRKHCPDMKEPDSRPRSKNKVDNIFDNSKLMDIFPGFEFTPLAQGIKYTVTDYKNE